MSESSGWEGSGRSLDDARRARATNANLQAALRRARTVGMALGIVMERQCLSEHEAWEVLLYTSRRSLREVHDIAAVLIDTGELPSPGSDVTPDDPW